MVDCCSEWRREVVQPEEFKQRGCDEVGGAVPWAEWALWRAASQVLAHRESVYTGAMDTPHQQGASPQSANFPCPYPLTTPTPSQNRHWDPPWNVWKSEKVVALDFKQTQTDSLLTKPLNWRIIISVSCSEENKDILSDRKLYIRIFFFLKLFCVVLC